MLRASVNLHRLRRRLVRLALLAAVLASLMALRAPLLRGLGNLLVQNDAPMPADALFVLAGKPVERGHFAARMLQQGWAPVAVCTGGLPHEVSQALGHELREADLTLKAMRLAGAEPERLISLPLSTSTWEEAQVVAAFARKKGWKRLLVVSSWHHTARVAFCLRRCLPPGVQWRVLAAPSRDYDPRYWWRSEHGLIFVANESLKTLLYYWKYG